MKHLEIVDLFTIIFKLLWCCYCKLTYGNFSEAIVCGIDHFNNVRLKVITTIENQICTSDRQV